MVPGVPIDAQGTVVPLQHRIAHKAAAFEASTGIQVVSDDFLSCCPTIATVNPTVAYRVPTWCLGAEWILWTAVALD
jgi:hypothetical protein